MTSTVADAKSDTSRGPRKNSPADPSSKRNAFRPDIEGLRAYAVVLVVLCHMELWPSGGFIGVDVFFVISGYLITGLIADELKRTGGLSIRGFYVRRARRILPAALTVLFATWVAATLVFSQARVHQTVHDIWWSLAFAANIDFARSGTDYFQAYTAPSLVQHFWSLAVEEQFYVVWPLLLVVLTMCARRWAPARVGRVVIAATAVGIGASFAWSIYQTATSPAPAYFGTPGRAWELGLGALVALATRHGIAIPARLANPLALAGLLGIIASAAVITDAAPFPGPTAALPVVATALFLFAGNSVTDFNAPWHRLVNNPPARYVGRLSFSLYLWHWPAILVVSALVSVHAVIYYPLLISAMATLTLFSFYAVEETFRHQSATRPADAPAVVPTDSAVRAGPPSEWSTPRLAGPGVLRARTRARRGPTLRQVAAVGAVGACTLMFWTLRPAPPAPVDVTGMISASASPAEKELQQQLASALQATSWPAMTPSLESVIAGNGTPPDNPDCVGPTLPAADLCSFGDPNAPKLAVVVGDSTAQAYMDVLKHFVAQNATQWRIRFIGMAGCNFLDYRIANPVKWVSDACPKRKKDAVDLINQSHPDMVIWSNVYGPHINAESGRPLTPQQWVQGVSRYIDQFKASTKNLVLLASPVWETDIQTCYTAVSVPASCISHVTGQWQNFATRVRSLAASYGATYIDSVPWFCVAKICPAFVHDTATGDDVATKKDILHITPDFADVIAPAAWASFQAAGLFS